MFCLIVFSLLTMVLTQSTMYAIMLNYCVTIMHILYSTMLDYNVSIMHILYSRVISFSHMFCFLLYFLTKLICIAIESIFTESINNGQTSIVGEIYRIPNTSVNLSIQRYEAILQKMESSNSQVIIGTDQNFDYLKIKSYKPSNDLLHLYLAANIIPTITKPTRITHTSAILIDNIYEHNRICSLWYTIQRYI